MISILNVRFTNSKDWPVFFGDGLFFKASSHPMSSSLNGASTLRCLRTWKGILDPREKGAASARSWGHGADSERNGVLSLCSSRFEIRKMKTNNDIYVYCIYIYIGKTYLWLLDVLVRSEKTLLPWSSSHGYSIPLLGCLSAGHYWRSSRMLCHRIQEVLPSDHPGVIPYATCSKRSLWHSQPTFMR